MPTRPCATALLAAAMSLPFAPARAQEAPCAAEDTTPKTAACLQKVLDAQDQRLAAAHRRLMAEWRERDTRDAMFKVAPALQASQAAWEAYRDEECRARMVPYGPGTGAGAEYLRCMAELSAQRLDLLERYWR